MATAATHKPAPLPAFPGGFPGLFETYGQALADHVARAFPPQYRLQPPAVFLARIRGLGRAPFPAQLHAAAALATRLQRHASAMLVGEASVGKTQIALTTAAMLGARSVLVVAGSNLLSQWAAEIRAVLPGARVYSDLTSITKLERTLATIRDTTGSRSSSWRATRPSSAARGGRPRSRSPGPPTRPRRTPQSRCRTASGAGAC